MHIIIFVQQGAKWPSENLTNKLFECPTYPSLLMSRQQGLYRRMEHSKSIRQIDLGKGTRTVERSEGLIEDGDDAFLLFLRRNGYFNPP